MIVKFAVDNEYAVLQITNDTVIPVPDVLEKFPEIYDYPVSTGVNVMALWTDGRRYAAEIKDIFHDGTVAKQAMKRRVETDKVFSLVRLFSIPST